MLDWLGKEGEQLRNAFIQVFGERCRPFGNRALQRGGLSDGNEGVQWNAGYDPRNETGWVGVNLEGLKYQGWPIARLIQRELRSPTLPSLVRRLGATDPVEVRWRRDYWQATSRPPVEEGEIAPTPILASRLAEDLWLQALQGAAGCLSNWRGRALQEVTLAQSGRRVVGPVSPHLTIAFPSHAGGSWMDFLGEGKARLQPFYDWAVERAA